MTSIPAEELLQALRALPSDVLTALLQEATHGQNYTPFSKNKYVDRVCHNIHCARTYTPKRRDQKHCDGLCSERCRACHQPYEARHNAKMRKQRRLDRHGMTLGKRSNAPEAKDVR